MTEKPRGFLGNLYDKLFRINDSPQRIALGISLGVFAGLVPGVGILTAIFLAFIFRANRAAALAGVLLSNTWTSLLSFVLSVKIGSAIMGLSWSDLYNEWMLLIKDFHLSRLNLSILRIAIPVAIGYLIIAVISGISAYLITILILKLRAKSKA